MLKTLLPLLTLCYLIITVAPLNAWAGDAGTLPPADAAQVTAAVATPAPASPAAEPAKVPAAALEKVTLPAEPVAPAEKEQSWWQALLMPLLSAVGLALAAFFAAGFRKVITLAEKKWDFEVPDVIEDTIINQAKRLIAWAEEKAEDRLLNGDGKKTPGAEKIGGVVTGLEEFVASRGWDRTWQRDKLEKLAESVLHLERSGNTGVGTTNGDRKKKLDEMKAADSA